MRYGEEVSLQSSSKINNLDPFIDENEVLRVVGRIKILLVKWYHQSFGHGGRGYTLNKIRSSRYWIVKANLVV